MTDINLRIGDAQILRDARLHADTGELVALIGPNGAGKSTLFAVAAGDTKPTGGTVELFGTGLAELSPLAQSRRRAVQVQQHRVSYAYLVREVVGMGRWPWRGTAHAADDDAVVDAALRVADLEEFTTREVTTMSGGEQARCAFARMVAQQGRLVLADEPTAALDIGHQELILAELRRLADLGAAVVTVLHDLNLAAAFADRVVLMERGRVVGEGPPTDVLTPALLSRVYATAVDVIPHPHTGQPLVLPVRQTTHLERSPQHV